jgi:hypothetical protein
MTIKETHLCRPLHLPPPPPATKVADKPPTVNGVTLNKNGFVEVFDANDPGNDGVKYDIFVGPSNKPGLYDIVSPMKGQRRGVDLKGARDTVRTWIKEYNALPKPQELRLDDENTFKPWKNLPLYRED